MVVTVLLFRNKSCRSLLALFIIRDHTKNITKFGGGDRRSLISSALQPVMTHRQKLMPLRLSNLQLSRAREVIVRVLKSTTPMSISWNFTKTLYHYATFVGPICSPNTLKCSYIIIFQPDEKCCR